MCRMLDRVTDTFLQPSQRKCSCSSRLLGMAFQLRRCLAFLQPFFFLHSGLWHCRHVLQCIHKSIKSNRKCYQRYIKNRRCVGNTLDFFFIVFLCCFLQFCFTFGIFLVLFASFLGSFWCPWALFWHPWALFWRPWALSQKNEASGTNWERIRGPNRIFILSLIFVFFK